MRALWVALLLSLGVAATFAIAWVCGWLEEREKKELMAITTKLVSSGWDPYYNKYGYPDYGYSYAATNATTFINATTTGYIPTQPLPDIGEAKRLDPKTAVEKLRDSVTEVCKEGRQLLNAA